MSSLLKDNEAFLSLAADKLLPAAPVCQPGIGGKLNGDHSLQVGNQQPWSSRGEPRSAVVMVPVMQREEPTVLFTVRSAALREHSGQVAFPGGRVDPGDRTLFDAALREADEEIGLPRENVGLLGYLDFYLSGTNYLVTPVVAKVEPGFAMKLNPGEVTETFEVPLTFLMDPSRHQLQSRVFAGTRRYFYAISYGEHYIWGVTAGIIHNMYERLFRS